MKIHRQGKKFAIHDGNTVVESDLTFEQARTFLADQGNTDAAKPLVSHTNLQRGELFIEPEFRGEYELNIGRQ